MRRLGATRTPKIVVPCHITMNLENTVKKKQKENIHLKSKTSDLNEEKKKKRKKGNAFKSNDDDKKKIIIKIKINIKVK